LRNTLRNSDVPTPTFGLPLPNQGRGIKGVGACRANLYEKEKNLLKFVNNSKQGVLILTLHKKKNKNNLPGKTGIF
jgi:hypothetical protein